MKSIILFTVCTCRDKTSTKDAHRAQFAFNNDFFLDTNVRTLLCKYKLRHFCGLICLLLLCVYVLTLYQARQDHIINSLPSNTSVFTLFTAIMNAIYFAVAKLLSRKD